MLKKKNSCEKIRRRSIHCPRQTEKTKASLTFFPDLQKRSRLVHPTFCQPKISSPTTNLTQPPQPQLKTPCASPAFWPATALVLWRPFQDSSSEPAPARHGTREGLAWAPARTWWCKEKPNSNRMKPRRNHQSPNSSNQLRREKHERTRRKESNKLGWRYIQPEKILKVGEGKFYS